MRSGVLMENFRASDSGRWAVTIQWYLWLNCKSLFKLLSNGMNSGELPTYLCSYIVFELRPFNGFSHLSYIDIPWQSVPFMYVTHSFDVKRLRESCQKTQSSSWTVPSINLCDSLATKSTRSDIGRNGDSAKLLFSRSSHSSPYFDSYGFYDWRWSTISVGWELGRDRIRAFWCICRKSRTGESWSGSSHF